MNLWSFLSPISTCYFCDSPLKALPMSRVLDKLCSICKYEVKVIGSYICHICGKSMNENVMCLECEVIECEIFNRSVVEYNEWAKELIWQFKYKGRESFKDTIGEWMAEVVFEQYKELPDLITFVPINQDKLKIRGFNQSELLAQVIGGILDVPVVKLLTKNTNTVSQSQKNRQDRLKSLEGTFSIIKDITKKVPRDDRILIVDDVYTTGSTLRECKKMLTINGLKHVFSITFAR